MSRRRRAALGLAAGAGLVAVPGVAAAHAIDAVYQLPVPLGLYLWAAGAAVAASFVVSALVVSPPGSVPRYPRVDLSRLLSRVGSVVLSAIGLVWWLGAIVAGFVIGDVTILPAVLFWSAIWVGVPIVAVLLGNPWPALSPFRTIFSLLEALARRLGRDRLDAGFAYPAGLQRWPAVALLLVALWFELAFPGANQGTTTAWLLSSYTLLTLAGMALFGRVAWLRNGELLEVLFGWFGRVGPIGRRVADPDVCVDCAEGCSSERCIDCPECVAAADPGELRLELRPPVAGLTDVRRAGWSDAALILLALAGVSFDGFQETIGWGWVLTFFIDQLGPRLDVLVAADTIGIVAGWLLFMGAFALATSLTRSMEDRPGPNAPMGEVVGTYASTLLPIAGGYLIAHYLTLVIQTAVWLPSLVVDPIAAVPPSLSWIPSAVVWYVSVAAIVGGHIAAVVLAHRLALRDAPGKAVLAGVPLVALMVAYTVLSLWIIAQPMVVDPGIPVEALGGP